MDEVILSKGRDRSVRRRHPWVLSGSVARVEGSPGPGDTVGVRSAEGERLGFGHYSPQSQIRVRLLGFGKEAPDEGLLVERVRSAVERRRSDPLLFGTDAIRLVNAEGDGLPGLVVDRYAECVVMRCSSAGMVARAALLAAALRDATGVRTGVRRDDSVAARREGFEARQEVLFGEAPEGPIAIDERGRRYLVDVLHGQKTGFYLDQRDARDLVERLARGRRVLDLFSYTGGFSVAAARGGASEISLVDSSAGALAVAARHLEPVAGEITIRSVEADGFRFLRTDPGMYDLLVLDPPPLAKRRGDVAHASRAYKDLVLHALGRAAPGAFLLAFSCSHAIDPVLFRQIVFGASLDAGRSPQVLAALGPPSDHPVSIDHPEGAYLGGLLLRA